MKTATIKQLKDELSDASHQELIDLCLRLSRFKKENKELLTYLLFEASDENEFIKGVKTEVTQEFKLINTASYHYIKKSVRRILRRIKIYIRYSKKKETEVELLLHFCQELKSMTPSMNKNVSLLNIYNRQILLIKKAITTQHEDLQYDYNLRLQDL